jgi:NADPH:quinone reductase-like Zn-dependent oxidoreductase
MAQLLAQSAPLLPDSHCWDDQLGGDEAQPSAPGAGEILVRVQACGASPAGRALRTRAVSQLAGPGAGGMDAAGTVIATGDHVTRFAVGDEVFGHLPAGSWSWVQPPCARTTAGAHIELRPEGIDPLAAATLAGAGLRATTLLRAAEPRPGETALLIGATSDVGRVLVPLLSEAGVRVIADATPEDDAFVRSLGAAETFECADGDPVAAAVAAHPDVELLVDLVSFDLPYFITGDASHGMLVTALPVAHEAGIGLPRIGISAEPGDLAALAQRAVEARPPVEIATRLPGRKAGHAPRATALALR